MSRQTLNRLAALCVLSLSFSALAADEPVATVTTATGSAACTQLRANYRMAVQCTTDSIVTIRKTDTTTALVEGSTGTYVELRKLYDTSTTDKAVWGCATAATSAGTCLFMRVDN